MLECLRESFEVGPNPHSSGALREAHKAVKFDRDSYPHLIRAEEASMIQSIGSKPFLMRHGTHRYRSDIDFSGCSPVLSRFLR